MLFTDYRKFIDQTGLLVACEPFDALSISPCTQFGHFFRDRINELSAFCMANPDFHIVSRLNSNVILNRFVPSAIWFYLATGDRNPHTIYDTTINRQDLDVLELRSTKSSA